MAQGGWVRIYNLLLNTKIGMGVCVICLIPCACVACTSMLDKPWILDTKKKYKRAINLSPSALIGHYYNPLTIGT